MSQNFRLIGTMNDSDRTFLHKLSYALLRRFDVIRVDPPSNVGLNEIAKNLEEKIISDDKNYQWSYLTRAETRKTVRREFSQNGLNECLNKLKELFCDSRNLINMGIVGTSTLRDVFDYIHEGLKASPGLLLPSGEQDNVRAFVCTLATLALVLKVLPQLDAIHSDDLFEEAINLIAKGASENPFLQIEPSEQGLKATRLNPDTTCRKFFLDEAYKNHIGTDRGETIKNLLGSNQ